MSRCTQRSSAMRVEAVPDIHSVFGAEAERKPVVMAVEMSES